MNPFGLVQAALVALEGLVQSANPKQPKETKKEKIGFLIFYFGLLLAGLTVVVWTIHSLYFATKK